ncbi:MAG: 2-oxoacid:acceptor oxidoreductase family protein [Nitrospirota bacterium]|nr:2-oxoacid:acceptor oxidoreductase family protein [Nitrospirota bacterium]MDH5700253.1 2-oxoacid:acceptor oxidoreductase family protein [Nitrospirota bacterium]
MIRIRFHGRGGHGIKTASRIVGTAAFLAGYQVQDSPIYGAERRGAPVTAFTRMDTTSILERGIITQPNFIICGDETLLESPATGVLVGRENASAVFINTSNLEALKEKVKVGAHTVALDITQRTLAHIGKASALSVGLGAAAVRLSGLITIEQLREAVGIELEELGLDAQVIEKNLRLAEEVYGGLEKVTIQPGKVPPKELVHEMAYDPVLLGTPSILAPGNAEARQTGSWRVERPEIDYEHCTRCGLCFVGCPDGAIALDEQGYPVIDYDHCKGCLICLEQCPRHSITSKKEVRSW